MPDSCFDPAAMPGGHYCAATFLLCCFCFRIIAISVLYLCCFYIYLDPSYALVRSWPTFLLLIHHIPSIHFLDVD